MTTARTIPDSWIKDSRTITATGRIVSTLGLGNRVRIELDMPADAVIEAVKKAE